MSEKEAIEEVYFEIVKRLFVVLHDAYILAKSKAEKDAAVANFKAGLAVARDAKTAAQAAV